MPSSIIVTGGIGYTGRAAIRALAHLEIPITAIGRDPARLATRNLPGVRGLATDLRGRQRVAALFATHETVVHLAQPRDPDTAPDLGLISALFLDAESGSIPKQLDDTSGTMHLGSTQGSDVSEADAVSPGREYLQAWRGDLERQLLTEWSQGLTTTVIRPGFVYGGGAGVLSWFFTRRSCATKSDIRHLGHNAGSLSIGRTLPPSRSRPSSRGIPVCSKGLTANRFRLRFWPALGKLAAGLRLN